MILYRTKNFSNATYRLDNIENQIYAIQKLIDNSVISGYVFDFYNPFTITIITLKFVSQRKIITSVNHLITRGALSPTTLFACEAHELYTFTRKLFPLLRLKMPFWFYQEGTVLEWDRKHEILKSNRSIMENKKPFTLLLCFSCRDSLKTTTIRMK